MVILCAILIIVAGYTGPTVWVGYGPFVETWAVLLGVPILVLCELTACFYRLSDICGENYESRVSHSKSARRRG